MYLAQKQIQGKAHYFIRESYHEEACMKSRDLFDLGTRPDEYIIYPGGNSYYIHEDVYDSFDELGVDPDDDQLEKIFWPFIRYETRRVIEGFTHRGSAKSARNSVKKACKRCEDEKFHLFDMRRIHYLRFGQLDQSQIYRAPKKIYRRLLGKSRDEIEQLFLQMERVLDSDEKKNYAFVIFDVPGHFSGKLARNFPQALIQEKVDTFFLNEVCRLDADESFWAGMSRSDRLNEHLVRYLCWFFDHGYAQSHYLDQLVQDWMRRHRSFNPPRPKSAMATDEALSVMGISKKEIASMTVKTLTRQYRKMAREYHPDTGGDHKRFIKLNLAYEDLLGKIRGRGEKSGYRTRRG